MTDWEKFFEQKIKEIAEAKEVLDVGGGKKFQKSLSSYQELFKDCHYQTLDNVSEY